jgi:hypothetical protein
MPCAHELAMPPAMPPPAPLSFSAGCATMGWAYVWELVGIRWA